MLDCPLLTLSRLVDNTHANKIDDDKESHSCPNEAFRGALASSQPNTEQALEEAHQYEDAYYFTAAKVPIIIAFIINRRGSEKAEQADQSCHKHDLSREVEGFGCASKPRVVRVANCGEATIKLKRVTEEFAEGLILLIDVVAQSCLLISHILRGIHAEDVDIAKHLRAIYRDLGLKLRIAHAKAAR